MKFLLEVQIGEDAETIEEMAGIVEGVAETLRTFDHLTGGHDLRKPMCKCGKCPNTRLFIAELQDKTTGAVTLRMKIVEDEDVNPTPEVKSVDPGFVFDPEEGINYRERGEDAEVLQ